MKKDEIGYYIITKGKSLNKYEQMIRRIIPYSLYAEHLWYKENGQIVGTSDDNGNMLPFTIEL